MDVRMEPILEIDVGWSREAVWDNVICRHRKSPVISTWTTRRRTKGEHLVSFKDLLFIFCLALSQTIFQEPPLFDIICNFY